MSALRFSLFCLGLGLVVGCSGSGATGEVSGAVSYDGKPIESGSITFMPADGNGPTAGGTIANGTYTASKVPIGKSRVRISGVKGKMVRMYEDGPTVQSSEEILPEKYHNKTELTYDVVAGPQTKNFDLPK